MVSSSQKSFKIFAGNEISNITLHLSTPGTWEDRFLSRPRLSSSWDRGGHAELPSAGTAPAGVRARRVHRLSRPMCCVP